MPSAIKVLQDHTVLQRRSLDRLYLNAYIPELQRPESVKRFLERERTPIASPALFQARSDAFVKGAPRVRGPPRRALDRVRAG